LKPNLATAKYESQAGSANNQNDQVDEAESKRNSNGEPPGTQDRSRIGPIPRAQTRPAPSLAESLQRVRLEKAARLAKGLPADSYDHDKMVANSSGLYPSNNPDKHS